MIQYDNKIKHKHGVGATTVCCLWMERSVCVINCFKESLHNPLDRGKTFRSQRTHLKNQ